MPSIMVGAKYTKIFEREREEGGEGAGVGVRREVCLL